MAQGKLTDPAEKATKEKEDKTLEQEMESLKVEGLTLDDFRPVPQHVARAAHPFDGYPERKITVTIDGKERELNVTHVVAVNPKEPEYQDPSGRGVIIQKKVGKGTREERVTIKSAHSRPVRDYENGGITIDCVFDREIPLADGTTMTRCCLVPSHSARAQICFKLDIREGRIQVDNRYVLPDGKQVNRLRRVYEMIVNPQLKAENLARWVAGETPEEPTELVEEE